MWAQDHGSTAISTCPGVGAAPSTHDVVFRAWAEGAFREEAGLQAWERGVP